MIFELVIYETDDDGRRTTEHGSTGLLSATNLCSMADTLHNFSTDGGVLTLADEIEGIVDAL